MTRNTRSTRSRLGSKIAGLAALAVLVVPAWAQLTPDVTRPTIRHEPVVIVPQSRVIVPPDVVNPIRLSAVHASITINGQVATTALRMTLSNPSSRRQEAEIVAPVPDGVAIRYFALEGLSGDGGARLLPREEARKLYEGIVRRMQDPAILEFAGYGFIRSNVFPVEPGKTQTITLTYEQILPADGARVDYALVRTSSLSASGTAWTMDITINSERPIATIYSPSHEIAVTHSGNRHTVVVSDPNEPGSLRLSIVHGDADAGVAASLIAYPAPTVGADGQGGYFMMLAAVPMPEGKRAILREVTIVLDRSGSMRGEKIKQARAAALQIIEGLDDGEFFNIIDYSDSINSFADAPIEKNSKSVAAARAYIKSIRAIGGTNIHDALVEALRQPTIKGTLPMVLFMTDGLPTIGQTRENAIRDAARAANTHHRRIFSFGVGFDVNAPLLTAIARDSRAMSTFVLPDEDVEVKVGQVFARLKGPILASPKLTFLAADGSPAHGRVRDLMPSDLPDVFEGDQLIVLGQYLSDEPVHMLLTGDYLGTKRTFEFTFRLDKASVRNSFVPRLWATRKIAVLLEQIRLSGGGGGLATTTPRPDDPRLKELVDEIVRLSLEFGILTEYTAFLADENNAPQDRREVAATLGRELRRRAISNRAGADSVVQELNRMDLRDASRSPASVRLNYLAVNKQGDFKRIQITNVQQYGVTSSIERNGRWIDGRLLVERDQTPDQTIEFGTAIYFELVSRLAREGNQAVLANRGEILLLLDGKRVLVRNPS